MNNTPQNLPQGGGQQYQPAQQGQPSYNHQGAGQWQQPQGGYYQPPAGGYYQPPTAGRGQVGKGGGWIGLLRVVLWLEFAMFAIGGLFCFGSLADREPLLGLLSLAGCVLVGLLVVGGGMVALDAAANIQRCATNSAHIIDLLEKK